LGEPPLEESLLEQPLPRAFEIRVERELEKFAERLMTSQIEKLGKSEWRQALGPLDGTWEGTVAVIAATDKTPAQFWHVGDRPALQVVIEQTAAVVRVKAADEWRSLNVGSRFQALDLTGGGFVQTVRSANGWVENWNLSVAKRDPETLLVFLSYVAGGTLERLDAVNSEFAVGAMGELKRRPE
jgi:hypothetical protein